MKTDLGTDFAKLLDEFFNCLDFTHGGCKWKDHLEEYSQARQRGNLAADASPRF